jgi:hypothetical protein
MPWSVCLDSKELAEAEMGRLFGEHPVTTEVGKTLQDTILKKRCGTAISESAAKALFIGKAAQLKARGEAFTRCTHVLNKPGLGVKSPPD